MSIVFDPVLGKLVSVTSIGSGDGNPGGSNGQIQINNNGAFGGITVSGDGTINSSTGALSITKVGGASLGSAAYQDAATFNPGGSNGQIQINNNGAFGGITVSGDGTINTSTGALSITKVNGASLGTASTHAHTDYEEAGSINTAISNHVLADDPHGNKAFALTTGSFAQTIPFTAQKRVLPQTAVTGALTFTPVTNGALAGAETWVNLVANGTNIPNLTAFLQRGGKAWNNTTGAINQIQFWYDGTNYCYAIFNLGYIGLPTTLGYASQTCVLNSNLLSGGGTDCTANLNAALTAYRHIILDGPALVSGFLTIPANTVWEGVNNGGVYLANASNCRIAGTAHTTTYDVNGQIILRNLTFNGNGLNQVQGAGPMLRYCGLYLMCVEKLVLENIEVRDTDYFAFVLQNIRELVWKNCMAYWSANNNVANHDSLHLMGNFYRVHVNGFKSINPSDDVLALNLDEAQYGNTPSIWPFISGEGRIIEYAIFENLWLPDPYRIIRLAGNVNPCFITNLVFRNVMGYGGTAAHQEGSIEVINCTIDGWNVEGGGEIDFDSYKFCVSNTNPLRTFINKAPVKYGDYYAKVPAAITDGCRGYWDLQTTDWLNSVANAPVLSKVGAGSVIVVAGGLFGNQARLPGSSGTRLQTTSFNASRNYGGWTVVTAFTPKATPGGSNNWSIVGYTDNLNAVAPFILLNSTFGILIYTPDKAGDFSGPYALGTGIDTRVHMALVASPDGTMLLYKNGVLWQTISGACPSLPNVYGSAPILSIGGDAGTGGNDRSCQVDYDYFGVWERVMTAGEISTLYASGNGFNPFA